MLGLKINHTCARTPARTHAQMCVWGGGGGLSCFKFFKLVLHWSKFPAKRSGLAKCVCVCFRVRVQHRWSLSHVSRGSSWATFLWLVGRVLTYTHSSVFFAAPPSPCPVAVLPFTAEISISSNNANNFDENNSNMYPFHQLRFQTKLFQISHKTLLFY